MKAMLNELKENDGELSEASTEYANLMFQMAILNSGFLVENPMDLTEPLEKLIKVGFGLSRDEPVSEIEIELDDEEDEGEDEVETLSFDDAENFEELDLSSFGLEEEEEHEEPESQ